VTPNMPMTPVVCDKLFDENISHFHPPACSDWCQIQTRVLGNCLPDVRHGSCLPDVRNVDSHMAH